MEALQQRFGAAERLQRMNYQFMNIPKLAFLATVSSTGRLELSYETATAATDGINTVFNPDFVQSLTDKELLFVGVHEAYHKCYRHLIVYKDLRELDDVLCNMANDYVINLEIVDLDPNETFMAFPRYKEGDKKGKPMGLYDPMFADQDSTEVFWILKEEDEEGDEEGDDDDEGEGGGEGGYPTGERGKKRSKKIQRRLEDIFDDHDYDDNLSDAELEEVNQQINDAIQQAKIVAGKVGGEIPKGILELCEVKVSWEDKLAQYWQVQVKGEGASSFRKFKRKLIPSDIFMPSQLSEKAGDVVIMSDTSGSISQEEQTEILSHVQYIATNCMPEIIHLLYWDTEVTAHETYTEVDYMTLADSTKPTGGGGTDPDGCIEYLKNKVIPTTPNVECIIIITDGYFSSDGSAYRELGIPVLWAVTGEYPNRNFNPEYGVLLNID